MALFSKSIFFAKYVHSNSPGVHGVSWRHQTKIHCYKSGYSHKHLRTADNMSHFINFKKGNAQQMPIGDNLINSHGFIYSYCEVSNHNPAVSSAKTRPIARLHVSRANGTIMV